MKTASPPANITSRSASAIIFDADGRLLLLMRDDIPLWVNVGGLCDGQEDIEHAMRREVLEEACTEVDILSIVGDFYSPKGNGEYQQERVFLCHPKPGQNPIIGDEGAFIEWFYPNSLPANISPKYALRIQYALKTKIQDGIPSFIIPDGTPDMLEFITNLKDISHFYKLDEWNKNPRVIKKRHEKLLQFDPLL